MILCHSAASHGHIRAKLACRRVRGQQPGRRPVRIQRLSSLIYSTEAREAELAREGIDCATDIKALQPMPKFLRE